jgi:predicted DsbA family dithiol-disulfide isomerase
VTVTWRSFELDPAALRERGGDRAVHLAEKYGVSVERAVEMQDHMTGVAAGEGLDFRFDLARSGNTFDAHRMLHLAADHGAQDAMKERLMRAYLTEGELVGDPEVLERLAVEVGLPRSEALQVLAGGRAAAAVRDAERTAAALGIHAVPFFVVDRALGASGAQPPEVLGEMLRRGWEARPQPAVVADG